MSLSTDTILTRGIEQVLPDKDGLAKLMESRKIRVYLGIDPTGNVLTLGHSVVLRKLQQFADAGHDTILLIGNGTVKIGDPTGKDTTRPELTDQQIAENFKTWKEQASKVLDFSKISIKHNGDWLDKLNLPDFIKLMAKTTLQQLIERDMFQDRLAHNRPIHTHELMYPLLQGYDSVAMDVDLEIGGTDQTFNMMMGRTLLKAYKDKPKWVLSTPIINGTDGRKMSKSYGNFVALTEDPVNMYGKLMRVADPEIITYFTLLTDVTDQQIAQYVKHIEDGQNPMELKKILAHTITTMYHDAQQAELAAQHFQKTVQDSQLPAQIPSIKAPQVAMSLKEIVRLCRSELSGSQAQRLIEQGGVIQYPTETKLTDPLQQLDLNQELTLRIGKRHYFTIQG